MGSIEESRAALKAVLEAEQPQEIDLVALAQSNNDFRRVVYTGKRLQFTVMSVPPNGEVGQETHRHVEQVFFAVEGTGAAIINGTERPFIAGDVLIVPQGNSHNIQNRGLTPLRFYTSYSPPNHLPNRVHRTKADADADLDDEKFGEKVR